MYRGVGLDNRDDVQRFNSEPISTSARPEIARQYQRGKPCCLIQIQVPAGTPILNLNDPVNLEEGHFLQAEEIVLPPGGTLVHDDRTSTRHNVEGALVFRYEPAEWVRRRGSVLSSLERLVTGRFQ